MTPKEKAEDLVDKFIDYVNCWDNDGANYTQAYNYAKQCALIAVDEVLHTCMESMIYFWQEVKQEINNL